ncbi:Uncharacterised protein [Enterobacter cloacae]|nr:Uncharacterised protein [Enterobacter cloacae]
MRVSNTIPTTPSSVPRIGNRRYFPVRLMMRPLMMEVSNSPPIRGISCKPACVGVASFTTCK